MTIGGERFLRSTDRPCGHRLPYSTTTWSNPRYPLGEMVKIIGWELFSRLTGSTDSYFSIEV